MMRNNVIIAGVLLGLGSVAAIAQEAPFQESSTYWNPQGLNLITANAPRVTGAIGAAWPAGAVAFEDDRGMSQALANTGVEYGR